MVYRTLKKRQLRMMKNNTIRILKQGKILISRDLLRKIKTPFVEVLIDEDYNKLALKPSKDEIRGYKIFNSNILQVAPLKHGQLGEFQARFTEGKIIVDSYKVNSHVANLEYYEDEELQKGGLNSSHCLKGRVS